MGPMGAALLLRADVLAALRVERSAVVRSIGEVDGDIDGFLRNEGADLTAKGEREGALGSPELQMAEEPPGCTVRMAPSTLGSGSMNGGAKDRRPEEKVSGVPEGGGAEGPNQGALQERK